MISSLSSAERLGELTISNHRVTRELTLLTFWPPGPLLGDAVNVDSLSGMKSWFSTWFMRSVVRLGELILGLKLVSNPSRVLQAGVRRLPGSCLRSLIALSLLSILSSIFFEIALSHRRCAQWRVFHPPHSTGDIA